MEALTIILNDQWNTRAWILQEAFASGRNLLILLSRTKTVNMRQFRLVCHEKLVTEICISFQSLYKCLKIANGIVINSLLGKAEHNTEQLNLFHPEPSQSISFGMSVGGHRSRDSCSAAVALSFLQHRENGIVADRLAIIVNLCGYELRLNTSSLQKCQKSLAVCILALAVMNGDFSLLVPKMYHNPWICMQAVVRSTFLPTEPASSYLGQHLKSFLSALSKTSLRSIRIRSIHEAQILALPLPSLICSLEVGFAAWIPLET